MIRYSLTSWEACYASSVASAVGWITVGVVLTLLCFLAWPKFYGFVRGIALGWVGHRSST
jgi:hypothetical protein